jgi:hypothetical protein
MNELVGSLPVGRGGVVELDDAERERLKSLGYLP